MGRLGIGDEKGGNTRGRVSNRAARGLISVEKIFCGFCGHRKGFSKPRGLFCCKCRKRVEE